VDFIDNARLYEQLMSADRAKNEFLAVLAHELRNPLAPIRNATSILRMAPARSDASTRSLEVIDRQMALMTRLVNDLLDLARITGDKIELRREPLDVSEILRVAVETSGPAVEERGQDLIIENPRQKMRVHGDLTRLAQAVSNLLDNASKFTPPS